MKHHSVPSKSHYSVVLRAVALIALVAALIVGAVAQIPEPPEPKLANGKSWPNEIAKADYQKNLKDAKELARLSAEIQNDLETGDPFLLPLKTLKKVEDLEKVAKDLRSRMRRN